MRYLLLLGIFVLAVPTFAQDKKTPSNLDAVLRVEIGKKRAISLRFDLPGKVDQSFFSPLSIVTRSSTRMACK
jgi:hypothetical protein